MKTVEIKTLEHVICRALQERRYRAMTFNEVWNVCSNAVTPKPITTSNTRDLVGHILAALYELDVHQCLVERHRSSEGRIRFVTVTRHGRDEIDNTIYTHQYRMGGA
jgi:predicted GTPase